GLGPVPVRPDRAQHLLRHVLHPRDGLHLGPGEARAAQHGRGDEAVGGADQDGALLARALEGGDDLLRRRLAVDLLDHAELRGGAAPLLVEGVAVGGGRGRAGGRAWAAAWSPPAVAAGGPAPPVPAAGAGGRAAAPAARRCGRSRAARAGAGAGRCSARGWSPAPPAATYVA